MRIFGSERLGNAALQRRDLYDYISLKSREGLAVIQCCRSSEVLNLRGAMGEISNFYNFPPIMLFFGTHMHPAITMHSPKFHLWL